MLRLQLQEDKQEEKSHIVGITIEMFTQLFITQLVSFIVVCNNTFKIKSRLPKKGKLIDAITGKNNLIKVEFDSHCMSIYVKVEHTSNCATLPERVTTEIPTPTIYNPITPAPPKYLSKT